MTQVLLKIYILLMNSLNNKLSELTTAARLYTGTWIKSGMNYKRARIARVVLFVACKVTTSSILFAIFALAFVKE